MSYYREVLRSYETLPYKLKPCDYEKEYKLKALNSLLKNSSDPYIKHFKNSFYELYNEKSLLSSFRFYRDYAYLSTRGNLIKKRIISFRNNKLKDTGKFKIELFSLNEEYYITASNVGYGDNMDIYIISSYSGIFNLLEQTQEEFISKMLNIKLKKMFNVRI